MIEGKPRVNKEINASFHYRASRSTERLFVIDRGEGEGQREEEEEEGEGTKLSAHRGLAKYLLE